MLNNLPQVTKNILILNIVFFLATLILESQGIDLIGSFGAHYVNSVLFKPFQIVTHFFMHGNILHIFFNMWMFIMLGAYLEQIWGPKRYFIFYLASAIGAFALYNAIGVFHLENLRNELSSVFPMQDIDNLIINNNIDALNELLYRSNSSALNEYITLNLTPMVGASGAISGLMAAFAILFPNTEFRLYFAIPVKAKYLVTAYFLFDLYMAWQNQAGDNTAHLAHVGGAIVGAVIVLVWRKRDRSNFW
jgi:membrane associated rhomboid family serine protease